MNKIKTAIRDATMVDYRNVNVADDATINAVYIAARISTLFFTSNVTRNPIRNALDQVMKDE